MHTKTYVHKVKQQAPSVVFSLGRVRGGVVTERAFLGNPMELVMLAFVARLGVTSVCTLW